jgi:hypothetical protein
MCEELPEVHSIGLTIESADAAAAWYVEDVLVRAAGEAEWTRYPCCAWLHAGADHRW